ncbi:capsular polysaccharide transport system permease protein [Rubrimonas cliftonensis]|uniref:Capsular polysaccharide transport system permease protein n=2 Tax=Rubrimonas cliftonensis TaxID=89524 RepID=A0A1H4CYX7_9RHOB|nr:capsular polysaccharide transport system permease protein [Rubrimonas cliftonensis]
MRGGRSVSPPQALPAGDAAWTPRLRDRLNLVWTLLWRSFLPRNRRESFQLVWVFAEPVGQLAVMILLFSLIGRTAGYGDSFALFLLTGIAMLTLFTRGAGLVSSAITGLGGTTRLAGVGMFHEAIAKALFETLITAVILAALAYAIGAFEGRDTWPHHFEHVAAALFWGGLLGFGFGLLRGYAVQEMPLLERIYVILSRVLIFVSGVFFVPSFMPDPYRSWLAWNPVVHVVELLRLGVYDQYPTLVYDADYLRGFALGSTALGMAALWRRRALFMG